MLQPKKVFIPISDDVLKFTFRISKSLFFIKTNKIQIITKIRSINSLHIPINIVDSVLLKRVTLFSNQSLLN